MKPIKVLMTKLGLDGHDRGVKVVTAALREAGMEVVYTGPWQTVESVVESALQEDVDVIGVSSLAYDHLLIPKLMSRLKEKGLGHILVIVGGIVPPDEVPMLLESGVARVFPPGVSLQEVVEFIKAHAPGNRP